jgi:hypothetical protein
MPAGGDLGHWNVAFAYTELPGRFSRQPHREAVAPLRHGKFQARTLKTGTGCPVPVVWRLLRGQCSWPRTSPPGATLV